MKRYKLSRIQLKEVKKYARIMAQKGAFEICGLLIDNSVFLELLLVKNASSKEGSFCFHPPQIRTIQNSVRELNHEIVGTFHSHVAAPGIPGKSDIYNAVNDSLMLIIDVVGRKAKLWHIRDKKAKVVSYKLI